MNQRIRELANQCNFTDADIEAMSPGFEKFAELIVRECSRVAKLAVADNKVCDAIEQHFGVE